MRGRRKTHGAVKAGWICASAFWLASCALFAPRPRAPEEFELPETYTLYEPTAPAPDRWWESFRSAELDRLIDDAIAGGLTIEQAYARLVQARALAVEVGAARWPTLDLTAGQSWTRTRVKVEDTDGDTNGGATGAAGGGGGPSGGASGAAPGGEAEVETPGHITTTRKEKSLGLASTYEVDLWGRVRSLHEAARLDVEATQEDLYTAALTLSSEVSLRWLDILSHKQRLALIDQQLAANLKQQEFMELRFRRAQATALDIYQQRQIVAETKSQIPPLEAALQTLQHELAVLLGRPPATDLGLEATSFPSVGALPEAGLPADLLACRPDVRSEGLRLQASDWRVSAARADRLPAIRLIASADYNAENWSDVFDNWAATLAASVVAPLFDAGRRRAEVERTRAVVREDLAIYRLTVLTAIREVEDAMINERKQVEFIDALNVRLEAARASYREALARYLKGLNDYLPVLTALTSVQLLERGLVEARFVRLAFRVQLHRALGGSWMHHELQEKKD